MHICVKDRGTPPTMRPGVDAVITQLEARLRQLLGANTTYVLVIAVDSPDMLEVQAVTDTDPDHAMQLLEWAKLSGFTGRGTHEA